MTRGGYRPGAGRKPKALKLHKVFIPDLIWKRLQAKGKPPEEVIVHLLAQERKPRRSPTRAIQMLAEEYYV